MENDRRDGELADVREDRFAENQERVWAQTGNGSPSTTDLLPGLWFTTNPKLPTSRCLVVNGPRGVVQFEF